MPTFVIDSLKSVLLMFVIELLLLVIVGMFFKAILKFYLVLVFFIGYSEILVSFSILFKAILKFQLFFLNGL